tara:strand:+ start:544 stop:696 length:153 start_codon:yes stop_codon:yes gene_type:complete
MLKLVNNTNVNTINLIFVIFILLGLEMLILDKNLIKPNEQRATGLRKCFR